jgi:sulfite reductase (ferredoxin)
MLHGAAALLKQRLPAFDEEPDRVVALFRGELVDTQLFHDPFAGAKFAHYFIKAHEKRSGAVSADRAHQLIEEAQLFIEAGHACYARMRQQAAVPVRA